MARIIALLALYGLLVACGNRVEVPAKVEACFNVDETGACNNEIIVRHIVEVQVPVALVNDCNDKFKDLPEPEKTVKTNECLNDYIKNITDLINNISPEDLQNVPDIQP